MEDRSFGRRGERGFALVLAILSLMLLTFLGLTMATTTSTELQIATNYRWSQQALYNAEAGLEAARIVLASADATAQWTPYLPRVRPGTWAQGSAPGPDPADIPTGRDFEKSLCDDRGGVGYGRVLPGMENLSSFEGRTLNGAFTVWVRRPLVVDQAGTYADDTHNDVLVVVAEGVAPYTGGVTGPVDVLLRARQATRVLETRYTLGLTTSGDPCGSKQQGQEGGSPMGENYNPCANVSAGAGGTLAPVFGGGDAGSLGFIGGTE